MTQVELTKKKKKNQIVEFKIPSLLKDQPPAGDSVIVYLIIIDWDNRTIILTH